MGADNYLQMMIDSLGKKKSILKKIKQLNVEQDEILSASDFDEDGFQNNMETKGNCIDELNALDEGFQSLYNRVREELEERRDNYKSEILEMKQLIKDVTEMGATIQAQESRNRIKVEAKFRQIRRDTQTARRSATMANTYYQNMNKLSTEPQFMDKKK